ncbi:alpha-2-macroglobulin-like protein 1 [Discoglossus pictus]
MESVMPDQGMRLSEDGVSPEILKLLLSMIQVDSDKCGSSGDGTDPETLRKEQSQGKNRLLAGLELAVRRRLGSMDFNGSSTQLIKPSRILKKNIKTAIETEVADSRGLVPRDRRQAGTRSLETELSHMEQYAVIIPSELLYPHSEMACVHLHGAKGESRVKILLNMRNGQSTLKDMACNEENIFQCFTFQVPPPSKEDEVATLSFSIHNKGITVNDGTNVIVRRETTNTFIQTDKAIYKPGQTVNFRVVSLTEKWQPYNEQDPETNKIGQWLNVTLQQGIADFSYPLSSEPQLGKYSIRVNNNFHQFSVEKYVLPKFEVIFHLPEVITIWQKDLKFRVCGRYTYGKPVQGVYNTELCRKSKWYYWWTHKDNDICVSFSGKLDKSGCSLVEVQAYTFKLNQGSTTHTLEGTATITEEGTGLNMSSSSSSRFSSVITKVIFVDCDTKYVPRIPFSCTVQVVDDVGSPLPGHQVFLTSEVPKISQNYVTDANGRASFKLDTNTWEYSVSLKESANIILEFPRLLKSFLSWAKTNLDVRKSLYNNVLPEQIPGHLHIERMYSNSGSFLKLQLEKKVLPCEGTHDVMVRYVFNKYGVPSETEHLHLYYLIVSRGSLKDHGSVAIPVNREVLQGEVSLQLKLNADVSPLVTILVYSLMQYGEMVADSAQYKVTECFKNKVSVGFSPEEVLPESDVSLNLHAAAGSLCALRVVDQSVVLMKPEAELTAYKIHSFFTPYKSGYDYRIQEHNPCHGYTTPSDNVYSLFEAMMIKIVTNSASKQPVTCPTMWYSDEPRVLPSYASTFTRATVYTSALPAQKDLTPSVENKEIVRKYFPETWIWDLRAVRDSGALNVSYSAPHTITDWNAKAFCLGPAGFGISPPTSLRTFQPFFVDISLPYSVIRGESFTVKASVFNHLKQCIKVQTSLQPSLELEEEPCVDCQYSSCLCADDSKTFYWNIRATKLGEVNVTVRTEALDTQEMCNNELTVVPKQGGIDTVIRPLLVQPGGILEETSHSFMLCSKGQDHSDEEKISLKVPENILEDSGRAYMTVRGDSLGTALQNMDRLLAMPCGCGEQNMVKFAPNIFILEYLKKTQQLNSAIMEKATKFLLSGYQRQLTYVHDDGSYSAFGKNDPEGNTWLTAFVVKSLSNAQPFIYINKNHLDNSIYWLKSIQQSNGCFKSVGKLLNNALKGGVEDDISLCAYVMAALLEAGISKEDWVVKRALSSLRQAAPDVSNVYTEALLAFTFTLSGETQLRQSMLEKLEKQAVRRAGQMYWKRKSLPSLSGSQYWHHASSAEVELTSYVLLALVSGSSVQKHEVTKASQIVNWLIKQQNAYGGFSSTQDTVVALQALSRYAQATFSEQGAVTVTVRGHTGFEQKFHVDERNRLLLQSVPLPDVPGEYTVTSAGSGCVYVQTVLRYNVPPLKNVTAFEIKVETKSKESEDPLTTFEIHIYTKYIGSRPSSNMALIEVKMLSGHIPVKSSIQSLEAQKLIQRSDIETDMVNLYLNEVKRDGVHLSFMVEQDTPVKKLKSAPVKIYDYYETDEYATTEYNAPYISGKYYMHRTSS